MKSSSETMGYRFRQLDNTYLVWLGTINRYIQMQEPAFRIFQKYASGVSCLETVSDCAKRYRISKSEAARLAIEIHHCLTELYISHQPKPDPLLPDDAISQSFKPYSEKYIRINNRIIRFTFGCRSFEQFIYPLLSHLECQLKPAKLDLHFELFKSGESVFLSLNKKRRYSWPVEEAYKLKGVLFLQIVNSIYGVGDDDWMGVIHASSVSMDGKALLFPAQPGGGKSTIASLLMAHGCNSISDDFTPISAKNGHLYTFPGRISIKPGSLSLLKSYFPELAHPHGDHLPDLNEQLSFLTPRHAENHETSGFPARAIVFVQYDRHADCELDRVDSLSVINNFLDESWLPDHAISAAQFLNWYPEVPCFKLRYGNHKKAIKSLLKLLEDES